MVTQKCGRISHIWGGCIRVRPILLFLFVGQFEFVLRDRTMDVQVCLVGFVCLLKLVSRSFKLLCIQSSCTIEL